MMRIKGLRHIASIYTICASLAFAAAMFLSCQKDIEKDLVTLYPIIKSNIETSVETRALAGNYSDYNTGTRQSIYAYAHAYNYTSTPQEGIDITGAFVPSTAGGWRSTLKAEDNVSYYLYCHTAIPGATGYSLNFTDAGHVNLSFSNLSVISDTDPLVSVAASGKTLPDNPAANTYPELTDGSYDIGKVEHVKENGIIVQSTKVFLALKHLYAKATLSFKIDADYNSLRTVKVKEVTVSTTQGATLEGSSFKYNYITHELNTEGGAISNTTTQKTLDIIRGLSSTAVFDDDGMTEIISASTGVHSAEDVVRQILAGATSVQVCSVLYKKGINVIAEMVEGMEKWMAKHNFSSISDFKGKCSASADVKVFERLQYLRRNNDLN